MKYSQFIVSILTFALGVLCVPFANGLYEKWSEPYVEVPQAVSESPIVVIAPTEQNPFNMSGGGSSGGQTCEDFIKSLGKLTKQSRRILAYTPCYDSIPVSKATYPPKASLKTCCRKTKTATYEE
ncbi:MAG TPA: hypothetical protein VGC76_18190 [Pyrinomonadaceae bacterium]|jgi:hypothetical protein